MDDLLTLDQAARLIPGATADTLKRLIRAGKLAATRPGKAFLTTSADVQEAIRLCRVTPKVRDSGSAPRAPAPLPLGSSSTEAASAALDSALAQAKQKRQKRSANT